LAHIIQKHVEFQKDLTMDDVLNLQNIIENCTVIEHKAGRIVLSNQNFKSVISLDWHKQKKRWLVTAYQKISGSPINTIVNDEPPIGGSGFRPPLTTKNNVDSPANNFNDFFTDSSRQTNDAQTLADQQAHLQRSHQETNSFREQQQERKSGSPVNTSVNNRPPTGGSRFRPPLTTKNNIDSPANNFNDFFTDSSRQTNDAQTLADQQAHLQRSHQETNSFREQQLKQLYRSFEQQRTETTPAPHTAMQNTSQKIADLQTLIAQKQDTLSRANAAALPPTVRQELEAELSRIQTAFCLPPRGRAVRIR
jgi:hypothetical protein